MAIDFPNSPTIGDTYTTNGKTYRWDGTVWGVYGTFSRDFTASDTEPTGVSDGHIWYRSDQSQTLIRYDGTWVEVGSAGGFDSSSTSFPSSLDSGTGFAAVEALQAKVGADSSAVTSSHDYKIADHASRLTTLEALGQATVFTPSWTNFTPGNATESWSYMQVENFVCIVGITTLGSTSSVTGNPTLAEPTGGSAAGSNACQGTVEYFQSGTGRAYGTTITTGGNFSFVYFTVSGSLIFRSGVTGSAPFTFATGDQIRASIVYQVS